MIKVGLICDYMYFTEGLRTLTEEERNTLETMTKSKEVMIKAAAYILLDNISVANYIIDNMADDDKTVFKDYPIYHLAHNKK